MRHDLPFRLSIGASPNFEFRYELADIGSIE